MASRRNLAGLAIWIMVLMASYQAGAHVGLPGVPPAAAADAKKPAAGSATPKVAMLPADGDPSATPPPGTDIHLAAAISYPNTYAWGNCTWYVASRRPIPPHWGNAKNWYYAAQRAGFQVGAAPAVGAVAWTGAGYLGHVAIVEAVRGSQVYIAEMNNAGAPGGGYNRVDRRWASASSFRYIY